MIVNNRLIADEIHKTATEVEEGQSISLPLARSGLFPPMAIEMIAVGEQSGTLETMLFRIADAFEKEVESSILLLTSLLEADHDSDDGVARRVYCCFRTVADF